MGRRLLALLMGLWLVTGSLPVPAQARLLCRATGEPMRPVRVQEHPTSCCAVRAHGPDRFELSNAGCCDLRVSPSRDPLPETTAGPTAPALALPPSIPWTPVAPPAVRRDRPAASGTVPPYRGPPHLVPSLRAPPSLS